MQCLVKLKLILINIMEQLEGIDPINNKLVITDEIRSIFEFYVNKYRFISMRVNSISEEDFANVIHHLSGEGEFDNVIALCEKFDDESLKHILNAKAFSIYFGTVLHSAIKYGRTFCGKQFYTYFLSKGAYPVRDYYGKYPWEVNCPESEDIELNDWLKTFCPLSEKDIELNDWAKKISENTYDIKFL